MQQKFLSLIGGGNMAQAIVFGLLAQGYPASRLCVCDPNPEKLALFASRGVQVSQDNLQALAQAEVVLLAVKPQVVAQVCAPLAGANWADKLLISIAAGVSIAKLQQYLPQVQHIVRVMPNTPALVGEGMSGLFAPASLPAELRQFSADLLSAVGKICWLEQEQELHAVTAGSGSSPAYFFLFMQAMQNSLLEMGLSPENARLLVQQSALGAAKMVAENPDLSLQQLRENVTSKGGTTAAAIAVFQQHQLEQSVQQAMQACVARSQQMEMEF